VGLGHGDARNLVVAAAGENLFALGAEFLHPAGEKLVEGGHPAHHNTGRRPRKAGGKRAFPFCKI
jgi:hypothetical protein